MTFIPNTVENLTQMFGVLAFIMWPWPWHIIIMIGDIEQRA